MNSKNIRKQFPILSKKINGKPLIYFDNAATAPKPKEVVNAELNFYNLHNANVHRGIHRLSVEATESYEAARETVRKFLGARSADEIVFTSGTTEGLNFLAYALGEKFLRRGDEILLSEMEHHSNIVPWQVLGKKYGWKIKFIPLTDEGLLDQKAFSQLLGKKTKIVSLTHASNVLGTINPIKKMAALAHRRGAIVVVDAAQSVAHIPINVRDLDCDFLVFSSHKLCGPTGAGALYGRKKLLETLAPYKFGGQMIEKVTKTETTFTGLPYKFEAGTMPLAQIIGMAAAIDYLTEVGWKNIIAAEKKLTKYALKKLPTVPGLKLLGSKNAKDRLPIFSFTVSGCHPHDIAALLDEQGIAVRSGHHCAQILHDALGITASTRASLGFYNTTEEIDSLVEALRDIETFFNKNL